MSIKIKKEQYGEFGQCLKITNGRAEAVAALEFGIRILHYSLGGKNVFCTAPDAPPADGGQWPVYGGHRLWTGTEQMPGTYCPDGKPVTYKTGGDAVTIMQPADEQGIEKEITLEFNDSKVKVAHRITNKSGRPLELAARAVSAMAPGRIEIIPFCATDTGMLHNRNISVWPYTDMSDSRVKWLRDYIILAHDSSVKSPFKIGINNKDGWAAYVNGQEMFIKRYRHEEGESYPDNNVSYETYMCGYMTGMETLSPVKFLAPGEALQHTEEWSIAAISGSSDLKSGQSVGRFLSRLEPLITC